MLKFTNQDTKELYDWDNQLYKDVWDSNWSLHFGVFEEQEWIDAYPKAINRLNDLFIKKWWFNEESRILDIWCGAWAVADYISREVSSSIVWVDLSPVRIKDAIQKWNNNEKITFLEMSADDLKFTNKSFSHVMSMSALYHVHNRKKAIQEIYRILEDWWIFIFEDFVRPNKVVSEDSRIHVYERLKYRTDFNHKNYQDFLRETWFEIIETEDYSQHMRMSYSYLIETLRNKITNWWNPNLLEWYEKLLKSYPYMVKAIDRSDLWRSFFLCKKAVKE